MFMTIPGLEVGRGHSRETRREDRLDEGEARHFMKHTHKYTWMCTPAHQSTQYLVFISGGERKRRVKGE